MNRNTQENITMKTLWITLAVMASTLAGTLVYQAAACDTCGCQPKTTTPPAKADPAPAVKPQTRCPVMGGAINKALYVDALGVRIYLCCPACVGPVKADPAKYIEKIKANGETPEALPAPAAPQDPAPKAQSADPAGSSPACPAGAEAETCCGTCGKEKAPAHTGE